MLFTSAVSRDLAEPNATASLCAQLFVMNNKGVTSYVILRKQLHNVVFYRREDAAKRN